MQKTPFVLLKYLGKALGNAAGCGFAADLLADLLPDLAHDVWTWWSKDQNERQRHAEVESMAQAPAEEIRRQVVQIVHEVMAGKPPEAAQAVEMYLTQVPAMLRKSLRRPADPTGTTIPPALVPRKADDLLRFLPRNLARFRPGDQPLTGVDWKLEQLLGMGGFGEVWLARNPYTPNAPPAALKFCLDAGAANVLRNEAAILNRVMSEGRHPGIVQLQHTYLRADTPCLEYEYVAGGDLGGLIQEWHAAEGGPNPQQAAKVVQRLAEVAGFAHHLHPPIVHRDLKPANILLQADDGGRQFKVADFGIGGVAVSQAIQQTSRGTTQGEFLTSALHGSYTPLYASPQQMRGDPPDPRDDVHALGVIWYQLLTGDVRAGRPSGEAWKKRLMERGTPRPLLDLMISCFEDEPADRPADGLVLAQHLESLAETGRPAPPPVPVLEPLSDEIPMVLPVVKGGMRVRLLYEGIFFLDNPRIDIFFDQRLVGSGSIRTGFDLSLETTRGKHELELRTDLRLWTKTKSFPVPLERKGPYEVRVYWNRWWGNFSEIKVGVAS
jgi:eukaryotic-like serine/threonine-protein kinase